MKNEVRQDIESMIETDNLEGLLKKAGELHGHYCSHLVYGVKAGYHALKNLGAGNIGMEEVITIIETNNCFSDGIQMVTGCTFGNNALIYRDYGKTAATVSTRDGKALRLVLKPSFQESRKDVYPEAMEIFDKLVVQRQEGTSEDYEKMSRLWREMAFKELTVPIEEMFKIENLNIDIPEFAPMFDSVLCESCGENVMKTRIVETSGKNLCIPCAHAGYLELNGSGMLSKEMGTES
ncbi:MAG: FmdE family protein [Bacteroidota bacterium]